MHAQQLHTITKKLSIAKRAVGCKFWCSALTVCISIFNGASAKAQPSIDDVDQAKWSYQLGTDAWRISASTQVDSNLGIVDERSNLLLPDTDTKWQYRNVSAYGWVIGNKPLTRDSTVAFKAQANQTLGLRVDEALIESRISPFLGARLGVVDYKTSWCRTYESNSVWIRDVEPICNFQNFRDVTGGAPGAQVFVQNTWESYLVQTQVGIYRPLLFNYAPKEFGDFVPAPSPEDPYLVQSNKKVGFNINVLNLDNAIEGRLSFIKGTQQAFTPDSDKLGTTTQNNEAIYAALSFPINKTVTGRLTHFQQSQDATCLSEVAAIAACNLNYTFKKSFNAIEVASQLSPRDTLGIGLSEATYNYKESVFLSYDFFFKDDVRETKIRQLNAAWRHHWAQGFFTNIQLIKSLHRTSLTSEATNTRTPSNGYAIGLRLGYQY